MDAVCGVDSGMIKVEFIVGRKIGVLCRLERGTQRSLYKSRRA